MTSTYPKMTHIVIALGLTDIVDPLIQRSGNGDMTNR